MLQLQPKRGTRSKRLQHCFLQKVWLANLQKTIKNPGSVLQMNEEKKGEMKVSEMKVSDFEQLCKGCIHEKKFFDDEPCRSCKAIPSNFQKED